MQWQSSSRTFGLLSDYVNVFPYRLAAKWFCSSTLACLGITRCHSQIRVGMTGGSLSLIIASQLGT